MLQGLLDPDRLRLRTGPLHLLACRPVRSSQEGSEVWSLHTRQRLLDHQLMLSRPFYDGGHHLKAVLGNPHTQSDHLQQLAEILNASTAGLH